MEAAHIEFGVERVRAAVLRGEAPFAPGVEK